MNNDIKTERWYNPAKMQRAVMLMEQFGLLSKNLSLTEDERKQANALFEHYRRLAMCILMKEFPEEMKHDLIIDVEYMKNMYKKYSI